MENAFTEIQSDSSGEMLQYICTIIKYIGIATAL